MEELIKKYELELIAIKTRATMLEKLIEILKEVHQNEI